MCQRKNIQKFQISESSNTAAAFFGKSNTGKAQTINKDATSKESQKNQRTAESILGPVSTLQAEV